MTQTTFCRADGGFGGPPREAPAPHPIPERAPDAVCDLGTRPEAALIYRLSGDRNPLHADPAVAKAGRLSAADHARAWQFRRCRPCRAENHVRLRSAKGLLSFACRFSAPVFPGETLRTEMWRDGDVVSFRSRVVERDVIAINNGRAEVRP